MFKRTKSDFDSSGSDSLVQKSSQAVPKGRPVKRPKLSASEVDDSSSDEENGEVRPVAHSSLKARRSSSRERGRSRSVLHSVQGKSEVSVIPSQHEERKKYPERKPRRRLERPLEEIKASGGHYTPSEEAQMIDFCTRYQRSHQLNDYNFAELVQGSPKDEPSKSFWIDAYEILPYRNKMSLRRFLQRRYHNFGVRGSWTLEQDEMLHDCVEKLGMRFILVGKAMNRHWEDCRDRYRNYHMVKDQKLTRWDDDEDVSLKEAVGDSILKTIQHEAEVKRGQVGDGARGQRQVQELPITESEASKALLWQSIAEQVTHRSRHQCYLRYNALRALSETSYGAELLKAIERADFPGGLVHGFRVRIEQSNNEAPGGIRVKIDQKLDPKAPQTPKKKRRKIKELYDGDRIDLVKLVRDSRVKRDELIDWERIRTDHEQFRPFSQEVLAAEWEAMKGRYSAATGRFFDVKQTRKAAKKLGLWLESTMSEAEKSRRWTVIRRSETPGKSPRRSKRYKSPMYVTSDEEDGHVS